MPDGGDARLMRRAFAVTAMVLALSGCSLHHKARPLVLPPFTPVELAQVPEPVDPPIIEADDDEEDLPPVPVAEGAAAVPRRPKRRAAKVAAPAAAPTADQAPPVQAAADASAGAASVIGELTPGGDLDPKTQHDATELIAANEKRLNGLPAETLKAQAPLVSNVRNFQKQAQQALHSGDAGGAKTLATKAKLLLDDLEKAAGL